MNIIKLLGNYRKLVEASVNLMKAISDLNHSPFFAVLHPMMSENQTVVDRDKLEVVYKEYKILKKLLERIV